MQLSWLVLLPPLLVLSLSIITKRVLMSLFIGILSAAALVSHFSPIQTALIFFQRIWEQLSDIQNLYTFSFLILLGILIAIINATGGATAYGNLIKGLLKSQRSTKFSTIILSILFMIDDFFSSLTVGCIMKPLTDSFKIPRAKLAFLIDSLAAPLVIIMPISTWIAMLLMQLDKAGITLNMQEKPIVVADQFIAYLSVIPFVFYSFITLLSVWFIVHFSLSFGTMKKYEEIARETGNLFGGKKPLQDDQNLSCIMQKGSIWDFILPITLLIISIGCAIIYLGNSKLIGGKNSVFETIQKADIFLALLVGCTIALTITALQLLLRKKLSLTHLPTLAKSGWDLMYESILILILAFTFSTILKNDLKTGEYLAELLIGSLPAFLLPLMFFITSLATSIATGSSWGTIAVMIPLGVPMIASFFNVSTPSSPDLVPMLYPVIGAIFSGAVAGDHVSPIGTTTVMSATSAGCYLQDHVSSQFYYSIPIFFGVILAYILCGLFVNYGPFVRIFIPLISGIILSLSLLTIFHVFSLRRNKKTTKTVATTSTK